MKKFLVLFALLLYFKGFTQDELPAKITEDVGKVTFLNLGLSYEKAVGRTTTLYAHGFLVGSLSVGSNNFLGDDINFFVDPALNLQYRFYYNYYQRQDKGKRTAKNSMNYLAPVYELIFSRAAANLNYLIEENRRAVNRIGVVWGFQRNYANQFSLDLNLGLGYKLTKGSYYDMNNQLATRNTQQLDFISRINIGMWLGRRK